VERTRWIVVVGASIALLLAGACLGDDAVERTPRGPIVIASDADFTVDNGVRGGAGTESDPYRIADYEIDAAGAVDAISIEGTEAWFVIENCVLFGAETAGVRLADAMNAALVGNRFQGMSVGVVLNHVRGARIEGNRFEACEYVAVFDHSDNNHILDNVVVDCRIAFSLYISSTNNRLYDNVVDALSPALITPSCGGNWLYRNDFLSGRASSDSYNRWESLQGEGNYWGNYRGSDADGDGFGDEPFLIPGDAYEQDPHPAIVPYHPDRIDDPDT